MVGNIIGLMVGKHLILKLKTEIDVFFDEFEKEILEKSKK